jgi:NADH:ubiquinone oxidoreductase subunit 2 (subunit N)
MIIDYYVIMLKLVILIVAICFLHIFKFYTKSTVLIEYPILICFLIFGLLLLVQSFDLVLMYLSLELVALTSYILSAFARKYVESLEAGIKYLILGSVASGFLLLGVSFLYGVTGCTDFYNLKIYFAFLVDLFLSAENFTINVNNVNIFDQNEVSPAIFSFVDIPTGIGVFKINLGVILGFLLINFGFLFKLSAAPFHM